MSGVNAMEKEDGDITGKVRHFGEIDIFKIGTSEVKFLGRDSGSNEVITIQKVVVKDKENGINNISNNSNSDEKEDTYKELPKAGTTTNNSAAIGILMVLAGMVITFGCKFKKVLK
ncbi:LPXTG-motif cell wall anchor domain-containing protein [Bacillus toyonensis]|nr:LPXTG-motif cell wall anchor domain-containing protein [Bacillus toyonensis]